MDNELKIINEGLKIEATLLFAESLSTKSSSKSS